MVAPRAPLPGAALQTGLRKAFPGWKQGQRDSFNRAIHQEEKGTEMEEEYNCVRARRQED